MIVKRILLISSLITLYACDQSQQKGAFQIPFEVSNGKKTATYEQTIEFCEKAAQSSPKIRFLSIGKSAQGRQIPLLVIDQKENFSPTKVRKSGNGVLLIQANIHPGEPDGNDAGKIVRASSRERE